MTIKTVKGDATAARPEELGHGVILGHIVNNQGGWGRGFVLAVDALSPVPRYAYKQWHKDGHLKLGNVQFIETIPGLFVANMIAQNGFDRTRKSVLLDYDALRLCLKKTMIRAMRLSYGLHFPAGMGSGLAGGNKEQIIAMIKDVAKDLISTFAQTDLNITLYEWDQKP